jgi:hypothetical protein
MSGRGLAIWVSAKVDEMRTKAPNPIRRCPQIGGLDSRTADAKKESENKYLHPLTQSSALTRAPPRLFACSDKPGMMSVQVAGRQVIFMFSIFYRNEGAAIF